MPDYYSLFKEKELPLPALVGVTANIYKSTIKYIALILVAVYIPVNVLYGLLPTDMLISADASGSGARINFLLLLCTIGINVLFAPIATASAMSAVKHVFEKKPLTAVSVLDDSLFKWIRLTLTAIIYFAIVLALLVLIVPAIYAAVAFSFYLCAVVMTDKWGLTALTNSGRLIRRRFFKALGYLILTFFATFAASTFFQYVATALPFGGNIFVYAVYMSAAQIVLSFVNYFTAVWYVNWNMHKRLIDD